MVILLIEKEKKIPIGKQEAIVLKDVALHPQSTVQQIQKRTEMGLSTVCRVTKKLADKGLVERKIYDDGKRIDARSLMIEVKKNVRESK